MTLETYQWSGLTRFRCPYCPFDDETELAIRLHIQKAHALQLIQAQEAHQAMTAELFDPSGNLITHKPADPALADLISELQGEPINGSTDDHSG